MTLPATTTKPASSVSAADRGRAKVYLERIAAGDPVHVAAWAALTDENFGIRRFKERRDEPLTKKALLHRAERLLRRGVPDLVEAAATEARGTLAVHAGANVQTMLDVAAGKFPATRDDAAKARVQREAASWCLEAGLGIAPPKGGGVQVGVRVETHVADAGDAQRKALEIIAATKAGRPSPYKVVRIEDECPAEPTPPPADEVDDQGDADVQA